MTEGSSDRIYQVLFLGTGNAARSIIAEAILNRAGSGRFRAFSAGGQPKDSVEAATLSLLQKLNHPTETLRPKSWMDFAGAGAPVMDFVFTICDDIASLARPQWPGNPARAHWSIPDPGQVQGSQVERALAVADSYRMLANRIGIFINLPLRSLDRLALARRLEAIGRANEAATGPRSPDIGHGASGQTGGQTPVMSLS